MKRHPALQDLSRDHHDFLVYAKAFERGEATPGRRAMMERRVADHMEQEEALAEATGMPGPPPATVDNLREHVRACERDWFEAIQDAGIDLASWHDGNRFGRQERGLPVGEDDRT